MKVQDGGRLNGWCADNLQWLHRTFGRENNVSAVLYKDEHTTHIPRYGYADSDRRVQ